MSHSVRVLVVEQMVRRPRHTVLVAVAVFLAALSALAGNARAYSIQGTVKNGTTGAAVSGAKVVAIQPSAGMKEVGSAEAKDGKFSLEGLPDGAPMFLLRTEYAGVPYNTVVMDGTHEVSVEVFESTTAWDGVEIIVPHLAVARQGDALHIEQLYEIDNQSSPARTVYAKDGAFRLWLPSDMDSITDCSVIAGEMPVQRTPLPTDTPDVYSIDYPIRPGVTRVSITYAVPYASGSYTLKAAYPLPVAHMMVFAVDSTLQVTSSTHEFTTQQSVHGMGAYALHGITPGSPLALTFTGGDPSFAGLDVDDDGHAHPDGATPDNIRIAPTEDYKISILVMIMVLLVLAGIVGMSLRDRHDPLADAKVLRAHYDLLVSRLAKLDDLHAANAIPDDAYRASREEMVGRLAALAMQLRAHAGVHVPASDPETVTKTKVQ